MNKSLKTGMRGSSRDIGLHTDAAGKGDRPRIGDDIRYKQNFADIAFPGVQGFARKNGVARKVYPRFA